MMEFKRAISFACSLTIAISCCSVAVVEDASLLPVASRLFELTAGVGEDVLVVLGVVSTLTSLLVMLSLSLSLLLLLLILLLLLGLEFLAFHSK